MADEFTLQKRMVPLSKVEPELAQHLAHLRRVAPESAKYLAQRMFGDTMVPGVGNKLAYEDFASRPKEGGVHVMIDANDFGRVNKEWGQSTGDDAIKAMGGALSRASRANRGKLFRVGGDEFRAYFETPEQAHSFSRHARRELEELPPVKGVHHHSVSLGLAQTPAEAEQALIAAKGAKKSAAAAPGHALTHAYSLLPGAAGPVQVAPRQAEIPVQPPQDGFSPVQGPAFRNPMGLPTAELAQAASLEKTEEMLAKMALIHSGPEPLPVWRVENEHGEGPYSRRSDALSRPSDVTPTPGNDFEPHEVEANSDGSLKFAFMSPEDAETWFGKQGLTSMRSRGFQLRQVLASKVYRSRSGRQVMFEPHETQGPEHDVQNPHA